MSKRPDDIDRRIIYRLMADARNTSVPAIAKEVNVSARTIRNRIQQLEERGILTGYHASVDFDRTGARLTDLFICTAPVPERERLVRTVLGVPGVVNARELMSGRENLHVTAIGTDTNDRVRSRHSTSRSKRKTSSSANTFSPTVRSGQTATSWPNQCPTSSTLPAARRSSNSPSTRTPLSWVGRFGRRTKRGCLDRTR